HNAVKYQAILDRKHALLQKMTEESGEEIKPLTMGLILSGDGKRADMFAIPGFHLQLRWNKYATDEYYVGTFDIEAGRMYWNDDWELPSFDQWPPSQTTKAIPAEELTTMFAQLENE